MKDAFEVTIKFLRKCSQFFISTFLKEKYPKSTKILGMFRAEKIKFMFFSVFKFAKKNEFMFLSFFSLQKIKPMFFELCKACKKLNPWFWPLVSLQIVMLFELFNLKKKNEIYFLLLFELF